MAAQTASYRNAGACRVPDADEHSVLKKTKDAARLWRLVHVVLGKRQGRHRAFPGSISIDAPKFFVPKARTTRVVTSPEPQAGPPSSSGRAPHLQRLVIRCPI